MVLVRHLLELATHVYLQAEHDLIARNADEQLHSIPSLVDLLSSLSPETAVGQNNSPGWPLVRTKRQVRGLIHRCLGSHHSPSDNMLVDLCRKV